MGSRIWSVSSSGSSAKKVRSEGASVESQDIGDIGYEV